ncbi:hypothetical protein [Burkholderia cenocepacia]|uniref:hypothetical protein n=1 Tax=Burkholderia cenocepacia TaxID=95486 RepID=UPI00285C3C07|nr:hypothetical protein [Burkholderia cenocepacia]MDR5660975.1 hypothetical protein [Burkholderia cenocepacia]MDR8094133.1 hypothetical protein [Burkholderia cenocepacia]
MTEMKEVVVTFNPDAVGRPGLLAARDASEVVRFAFHAMEQTDLSTPPPIAEATISYDMGTGATSAEERRTLYESWILSKAFTELARGIRETLEEAYLFTRIVGLVNQRHPTVDEFNAEQDQGRRWAKQASFPNLINVVNEALIEPLNFSSEFESLQKVRNCLEHRGGMVGKRDIDDSGALLLSLPRLRLFYWRGEAQIELEIGARVDSGDDRKHVEVHLERVTRERKYALGELVRFSAEDFHEISHSCYMFINDLVRKLPRPKLLANQ